MRDIICRGHDKTYGWIEGDLFSEKGIFYIHCEDAPDEYNLYEVPAESIGQYTGIKDRNGEKVFDGDIRKWYTVASANLASLTGSDSEPHYAVMTWIEEWKMWGWLMVDEYKEYLEAGVNALDETLFWTYNAGSEEEIMICGNIYENESILQ